MDSGLYAAYTGLLARTQALDTAANNLANAGTAGFRAQRDYFSGVLAGGVDQDPETASQVGQSVNGFGVLGGNRLDLGQGELKSTGNPLDLALARPGILRHPDRQRHPLHARRSLLPLLHRSPPDGPGRARPRPQPEAHHHPHRLRLRLARRQHLRLYGRRQRDRRPGRRLRLPRKISSHRRRRESLLRKWSKASSSNRLRRTRLSRRSQRRRYSRNDATSPRSTPSRDDAESAQRLQQRLRQDSIRRSSQSLTRTMSQLSHFHLKRSTK